MKIGHTGITWGIPADLDTAYRETAELGYLSFETFAQTVIETNKQPGGYAALVARHGIPTSATYCYKEWINPASAAADLDSAKHEADASKAIGASALVLQGGSRPAGGHGEDGLRRLADALNQIGSYCNEIGLTASLHPHTGTAIETRAEIDAIMAYTDPTLLGFAPDTGQIAKGGSDIVEVLNTHFDRIWHVHLKDLGSPIEYDANGKEIDVTGYANYEPIGNGVLPMEEILTIFGRLDSSIWVNVELDGTDKAPRSAYEAAKMSRDYLGKVLGDHVSWTR